MKTWPAALLTLGLAAIPAQAAPGRDADDGFAGWRGVSSCTSSACHNRDAGRTTYARGSEYAVWLSRDPHARAYQVLYDARAVAIQNRLNAADPDKATEAVRNVVCIRCHVAPEAAAAVDKEPVWFADGVGCESCHGPAGGWLAAHVGRAWAGTGPQERAALGFHNTKDLAGRAAACTECHVGGRTQVGHDLIAAGHPALLFEFSSFLDRYRPYQHWSEADDRRRNADYEAEAWAVGQAVSARAALKLLAARAEAAQTSACQPWPEFAEYDCTSCHHDLKAKPPTPPVGHQPGLPAWSWYTALTPLLPEPPGGDAANQLRKLREEMEKPNPDPAAVAGKAAALEKVYGEWLKQHARTEDPRRGLMRLSGPDGEDAARVGWASARQLSLAISAHDRSLEAGEPNPETAAAVLSLAEALRPPCLRDTPPTFDAEDVITYLKRIQKQLDRRRTP